MSINKHEYKKTFILCDDSEKIVALGNAIGHPIRLKMLEMLQKENQTTSSFSNALGIPSSNVMFHLSVLEKAELIRISTYNSSTLISVIADNISIALNQEHRENYAVELEEFEIPIGNFVKEETYIDSFKLYNKEGKVIGTSDDPYPSNRHEATLLEMASGKVTYCLKAPNKNLELDEVQISLEIASEAPLHQDNYKSEIVFMLNDMPIGVYLSLGDYGERQGNLNPKKWGSKLSQYGQLVTIIISDKGVFINGVKQQNSPLLKDAITEGPIYLSIDNPLTVRYRGGFNIYGKNFGDYPQDIKVIYRYKK